MIERRNDDSEHWRDSVARTEGDGAGFGDERGYSKPERRREETLLGTTHSKCRAKREKR